MATPETAAYWGVPSLAAKSTPWCPVATPVTGWTRYPKGEVTSSGPVIGCPMYPLPRESAPIELAGTEGIVPALAAARLAASIWATRAAAAAASALAWLSWDCRSLLRLSSASAADFFWAASLATSSRLVLAASRAALAFASAVSASVLSVLTRVVAAFCLASRLAF